MRRRPAPNFGLCLVIPDGVTFEDRLTGERVVRARTERRTPVPPSRLTLTPA